MCVNILLTERMGGVKLKLNNVQNNVQGDLYG